MEMKVWVDEDWGRKFRDLIENTSEGSRHVALVVLTNMLRWKGFGLDSIKTTLRYYAASWPCEHAMPEKEIDATIEDAYWRYLHEGIDPRISGQIATDRNKYYPPTLDELAASSSEKAEAIAEGLLYKGDLLLMFAGAGVGKSTRTENMAAQLASGNAVYGAFPVSKPYKVLLWELELRYDPEAHTLELANAKEYRKLETIFMIANLRKKGLTLQAIADAVGVNKSTVSRWARGEATPTDEYFQKLKELCAA